MNEDLTIDDQLRVNRVLDAYAEAMRPGISPELLDRFDRLTPEARRGLVMKKLTEETLQ